MCNVPDVYVIVSISITPPANEGQVVVVRGDNLLLGCMHAAKAVPLERPSGHDICQLENNGSLWQDPTGTKVDLRFE